MSALRPYQEKLCSDVLDQYRAGRRRVCAVMPTGGGKTTVAVELARRAVAKGGKVAWATHRAELVDQAKATLERHGVHGVEVVTVQGLNRPGAAWRLLVIDECHTAALAQTWSGKLTATNAEYTVGLTATPARGDGVGLGNMFDAMVIGPTVKELEELGHLVRAEYVGPEMQLRSGQIAMDPVDAYRTYFDEGRAILFAPNLRAAGEFAERFVTKGIPADVIEGELSGKRRRAMVDAFREDRLKVLCNVAILTEGFDLPDIGGVIITRTVGHVSLYVQMIGRGLRAAEGKTGAMVCDLQGNFHIHGRHDEPFSYSLEGQGMRANSKIVAPAYCLTCGTALDDKGQAVCTFCAVQRPELVIPRSVAKKMLRWAKVERIADPRRVKMLAMWMNQTHAKGWKPGAPFAKYKGMFGHSPPPDIVAAAKMQAKWR